MSDMTRAERWFWVQTLLPIPDASYFDLSYDRFLAVLPARPMGTQELTRLAFFAGAAAAFHGLADHDRRTEGWNEDDARDDLAELALEPIEYLRRHGIVSGK